MQHRIFLNSAKYANAEGKNISPRIGLTINKQEIGESEFNEFVNQYNVYLDEREACTKIRLTAEVDLLATNVLFNRVTEIVKNEGSSNCECLNFTPKAISTAYGKPSHLWGSDMTVATDDTQITFNTLRKNYTYLCGVDIFNNHVLRTTNKMPHHYTDSDTTYFNTISDILCDENGTKYQSKIHTYSNKKMHMYNKDNLLTYMDCINEKMVDKDGWLGFVNCSKMEGYHYLYGKLGIGRVLNNEPIGKYIDLYPTRNHYRLLPYYNKARNRYEKNWEYCLLYPYSSTTENISCINSQLKTLKISHIDENSLDDDDLYKAVIYSVAKHGLVADDIVRLYRSDVSNVKHEIIDDAVVDSVIDEYTFVVYLPEQICQRWISIYDEAEITGTFTSNNSSSNEYAYDGKIYHAFNEFINFHIDIGDEIGSQNLSFAKVVNDEQCEYYVRIFSRFPNLDFETDEPTEEFAYSTDDKGVVLVDKYADSQYEKTSTFTKLGYNKNAYGDDVMQIVFNDDINIAGLKDNLGRPLTSLYLSFMKTNYGYKRWYVNGEVSDAFVEHSHCFGKLNCGFKYNPNLMWNVYTDGNINAMNNVQNVFGLSQVNFRPNHGEDTAFYFDDDEIGFDVQKYFYGDLCYYSSNEALEVVLQPICYRFNTMQRELSSYKNSKNSSFKNVEYQDITNDDNDSNNFSVSSTVLDYKPTACPEGYYYEPHYEIPIRTFSGNISEFNQASLKIGTLQYTGNVGLLQTTEPNYLNPSDRVFLYNIKTGESTPCYIQNVLSTNTFTFSSDTVVESSEVTNYRIYSKPANVPSYAQIARNGSGILRWRELQQNGFEDIADKVPEYPFTNGCLYVNKRINIFLKRQDPFGIFGLADELGLTLMSGYPSSIENPEYDNVMDEDAVDNNDTYINEKNGVC